jgi:hypothetical protein
MTKRFLIPVLALAALGLPAGATTVAYCDGGGCGSNIMSAFNSLTGSDPWVSASPITFGDFPIGVLSGNEYTDDLTGIQFQATHNLTDSGVLDTQNGAGDPLTITVPETFTVVILSLFSQNGTGFFCIDQACDYDTLGATPLSVGYINSSPTGPWTIQIYITGGLASSVGVSNFNAVGASGAADTPEVGTVLLIGAGLIGMRWMKRLPRLRRISRTQLTA